MRRMLLIQYGSGGTTASTAKQLAQLQGCELMIANFGKTVSKSFKLVSAHPAIPEYEREEYADERVPERMARDFNSNVIDAASMALDELSTLINQNGCELIITAVPVTGMSDKEYDLARRLMYRLNCPLLFLPDTEFMTPPERIVYLTDLRYCQPRIIKFLSTMGHHFNSQLLIAHLSASGLPDIDETFANDMLKDIASCTHSGNLQFCNIKKTEPAKALDVLIHGLNCQSVAMVNNRHHFDNISDIIIHGAGLPVILFPF